MKATREGSGGMFDAIAPRYDLMNRLISLGLDRSWRRALIATQHGAARILDLATGTGDVALELVRRYPQAEVLGVDPSEGMLRLGRQKLTRARQSRVRLVRGDACKLGLAENAVGGATMAFGIRNVPDRPAALAELRRVIQPGGVLAILELSEPEGLLGAPARFHMHQVVPRLGTWLSGAQEYAYLARSIAAFPPPAEFCGLCEAAGFEEVQARRLSFGVVHLYTARVPAEPQ